MIKFDPTDLSVLFELEEASTTEVGVHRYQHIRKDGAIVSLTFNQYIKTIGMIVRIGEITSLYMELRNCEIIRVLDAQKKQIEVLIGSNPFLRFFVDLDGNNIILMENTD